MKKTLIFLCITSAIAFSADWNLDILPFSEVKPGMRGVVKTVFYGDTIEELPVEILEIMPEMYPKFDIILARLLGEKAELNGVVSGMSGSPVYIDGKLVGALAYRLGEFAKEPIAGIMPIEHMLHLAEKESTREIELSALAPQNQEYLQAVLCGAENNFWLRTAEKYSMATTVAGMRPIASPLVFSGFQPDILAPYQALFTEMGFTVTNGGTAASTTQKIEPGSAVAAMLITGDATISATGTVTAVSDNQLLAFGHSVFNHGSISLPLAGARVLWTLPSLMGSTKITATTEVVGTFLQDRLSGALGEIGELPYMIPVDLYTSSPFNEPEEFHMQMAFDPAMNNLLPLYLRIALLQAMHTARFSGGNHTTKITGFVHFADGRTIDFDDIYTSELQLGYSATGIDFNNATDIVAAAMGTVMVSEFHGPRIDKVELHTTSIPGQNSYSIQTVQLNKNKIKPGESAELLISLRDEDENYTQLRRTITIPKTLQARSVSVFVTNGAALTQYEVQRNRSKFVPKSFDHLLQIINDRTRPQNIYIQVRALNRGVTINGIEMNDLPPSIINTMSSQTSVGESSVSIEQVVYEETIPTEKQVSGAKRLTLQVEQPAPATSSITNGH